MVVFDLVLYFLPVVMVVVVGVMGVLEGEAKEKEDEVGKEAVGRTTGLIGLMIFDLI